MTYRPRKRFTEREVLMTVLDDGALISCPHCKEPITWADAFNKNVERDHYITIAEGGADDWSNCSFVHKQPCHARKTRGTKATTAGSDIHRIAKTKRLRGETKQGPKRKIPSRPFQKRPK